MGYCTDEFPAFYSRASGLPVDARVDTPEDVAHILQARATLGLPAAVLVWVPVPESEEVPRAGAESSIAPAVRDEDARGVSGQGLTPFLLRRMADLSDGRARRANEALLVSNARIAARIASAIAHHE